MFAFHVTELLAYAAVALSLCLADFSGSGTAARSTNSDMVLALPPLELLERMSQSGVGGVVSCYWNSLGIRMGRTGESDYSFTTEVPNSTLLGYSHCMALFSLGADNGVARGAGVQIVHLPFCHCCRSFTVCNLVSLRIRH